MHTFCLLPGKGDLAFTLRDLSHKRGLKMLSSNYTLYGDMSGRVMTALAVLQYTLPDLIAIFGKAQEENPR